MKINKINDTIPNLDRVVDNENKGIEVHAEMPVTMADAYNDSIIRRKIIEKNFKESDKLADDFIERNHKRDAFKMEVSAPLKKLKLSESLFDEENESLTEATQEFIDLKDTSVEDKVNTENKDMWYFVYDLFCSDSKNYAPINPVTGERIKRYNYECFEKSGPEGVVISGDLDFDEIKQVCDYYELDYNESDNEISIEIPTNDDDTPMSIKEYSKFIGKPIQARFKNSNQTKKNESLKEAVDLSKVAILAADNDSYSFKDSAESSCTVGELIDALGRFRDDTPVILGFDKRSYGFYSYGAIDPDRDLYNSKSLNIEESIKEKGLEESKQLRESWEYQDLIDDLVSRIDDPNDDDDVLQSIDDGLIYNRDLWTAIEENATTSEVLEALQDKGIDIYEIVINDVYAKLKEKGLIESYRQPKKLKESDEEIEVETDAEVKLGDDAPAGPEPNEDTGMAGMLIDAINDEWKTIDKYNSIKSTCASFGDKYVDFISVIDDIVAEENVHIGQLQKTLETISPNVEKIAQGEKEAEEQIDNTSVEIETKEEIIK